jgi:hypothetical protein
MEMRPGMSYQMGQQAFLKTHPEPLVELVQASFSFCLRFLQLN